MRLQTLSEPGDPRAHAPRLAALRALMAAEGLDAVIVPRADAHQGEYVADADARLRWLTGFSGSAGFAIVTADRAGVFVDGRYRVQVKAECDPASFTPVNWPETRPADWLKDALTDGGRVGYDPWLHSVAEVRALTKGLAGSNIALVPVANPVDAVWPDRPAPPVGAVRVHGIADPARREAIAASLHEAGQAATVLTLADSVSWLLDLRGSDIPRNPVLQAFAILEADGAVTLFTDPAKLSPEVLAHLGNRVSVLPVSAFGAAVQGLTGPVRIDPASAPQIVLDWLAQMDTTVAEAQDPTLLPKAVKSGPELAGMRAAHLRDAAAVVRTLAWLDAQPPGTLRESDVVARLEDERQAEGIRDISFDTIAGSGANGALPHYHVTAASDRVMQDGDVLVLDSGGQYDDGTTDITRTLPIGTPDAAARGPCTRVLQGMIDLTLTRWPRGLAGRDLDPVARAPLWRAGLDFDHGTGHGVGAALCVHEGPARLSRLSEVPLQPGMILSIEPGYYREGAFGIRIENLAVVQPADSPDGRDMLGWEVLTFVPIDRRLIDADLLSPEAVAWLDAYHAEVLARVGPLVEGAALAWLEAATAPLG